MNQISSGEKYRFGRGQMAASQHPMRLGVSMSLVKQVSIIFSSSPLLFINKSYCLLIYPTIECIFGIFRIKIEVK